MPLTTTLNAIRKRRPCERGWGELLRHLGKTAADDEPLLLSEILASCGLDAAVCCLRTQDASVAAEFAARCAQRVAHLAGGICAAGFAAQAAHYAARYAAQTCLCADHYAAGAAHYAAYAARYAARAADATERAAQEQIFLELVS